MKKVLLAVLLTLGISTAFAAKPYFGVFSGYPEAIGVQYTMDTMRLSVGLPLLGYFGVAGSVDMIFGGAPLGVQGMDLSYYYGVGASGFFASWGGFGSGFGVDGHGFIGVEWMLPNSSLGLFSEAKLGVGFNTIFGLWPAYGGRFGVNFHQ